MLHVSFILHIRKSIVSQRGACISSTDPAPTILLVRCQVALKDPIMIMSYGWTDVILFLFFFKKGGVLL